MSDVEQRTPKQAALLTSDSAWAWWSDGYERGIQSGYEQGYADAVAAISGEVHGAWMAAFSKRGPAPVRNIGRPMTPAELDEAAEGWIGGAA